MSAESDETTTASDSSPPDLGRKRKGWRRFAFESFQVVLIVLVLPMGVRLFAYQPFNIPSGSMLPTLRVGDYLMVSKLSYGYGPHSFVMNVGDWLSFDLRPDGVLDSGRVFGDLPRRGDVAVFKLPRDRSTDYIKRVIGIPGDRVQVRDGALYLNGELVDRRRLEVYVAESSAGSLPLSAGRYEERLSSDVSYQVLDAMEGGYSDNTREYVVPPNSYFMMGDNRDDSRDSRFAEVGFVPLENFVGRADIIFYSHDAGMSFFRFWEWPFHIRWERMFSVVR